jgi:hypothetical protein
MGAMGQSAQLFLDAETVRRGWKFAAPGVSSAVEAMDSSIDMTEDGVHDLVSALRSHCENLRVSFRKVSAEQALR